jgi:hypothetical protein
MHQSPGIDQESIWRIRRGSSIRTVGHKYCFGILRESCTAGENDGEPEQAQESERTTYHMTLLLQNLAGMNPDT